LAINLTAFSNPIPYNTFNSDLISLFPNPFNASFFEDKMGLLDALVVGNKNYFITNIDAMKREPNKNEFTRLVPPETTVGPPRNFTNNPFTWRVYGHKRLKLDNINIPASFDFNKFVLSEDTNPNGTNKLIDSESGQTIGFNVFYQGFGVNYYLYESYY
jgi:hypothetical protein